MDIKNVQEIAQKWARTTPQRAQDYREGVRRPRKDWQEATSAGHERWAQGVQAAVARGSFKSGVENAGTQTWQKATLAKGPSRWTQGVQAAGPDFAEGFAPYHAVLQSLELPERGVKGDPGNINRVAAVAAALHEAKVARQGGG